MIDLIWITEQIAVSGEFPEDQIHWIKKKGFTAIIDLRAEASDNVGTVMESGMRFLHLDMIDHCSPNFEHIGKVIDFSNPILDSEGKILIHCKNGTGRAPLAVIAILHARGMSLQEAVSFIENRHPNIGFSNIQREFIHAELEKYIRDKYL